MKLFYGWIIVGAGIVVTCVGFGAMLSLTVFLQPMSEVSASRAASLGQFQALFDMAEECGRTVTAKRGAKSSWH